MTGLGPIEWCFLVAGVCVLFWLLDLLAAVLYRGNR